jgi:hypothetical protein
MSLERVEHEWNRYGTRAKSLSYLVEHVEHVFWGALCARTRVEGLFPRIYPFQRVPFCKDR